MSDLLVAQDKYSTFMFTVYLLGFLSSVFIYFQFNTDISVGVRMTFIVMFLQLWEVSRARGQMQSGLQVFHTLQPSSWLKETSDL